MSKYIAWKDRPQAEQERGDRINIWRADAINLYNAPAEVFSEACRAFVGWFINGDLPPMTPFCTFIVNQLIDAQNRAVQEAKEKSEKYSANAKRARHATATDGQQSLPIATRGKQPATIVDDGEQSKSVSIAKSESIAEVNHNHHQVINPTEMRMMRFQECSQREPPSLQDFMDYYSKQRNMYLTPKGIRFVYDKLSRLGWKDAKGNPIVSYYSFFEKCYKKAAENNPEEIEPSAQEIDDYKMKMYETEYD